MGYHVGMLSKKTKGVTKCVFMTTGIFLQKLVNSPESMKRVTHIILDEVHERDLDTDLTLVVLKHLLMKENEGFNFKLVLMSATFNTELFTNYFSASSINEVEMVDHYKNVDKDSKEEKKKQKEQEKNEWYGVDASDWSSVY